MVDLLLKSLALIVLLAGSLFVAAGTLSWPSGWVLTTLYGLFVGLAILFLDRQLLLERARPTAGFDQGDAALASAGFLLLYPIAMATAGLDAVRYGWSPGIPLAWQVTGGLLFIGGYAIAFWAMRANRFFSTFVRIQTERGHALVTAGPYAVVRHPGYAGMLLAHWGMPLALGSLWAFLPVALGTAVFAVRTEREERTVAQAFPEYAEYQSQVRWRLAPWVW